MAEAGEAPSVSVHLCDRSSIGSGRMAWLVYTAQFQTIDIVGNGGGDRDGHTGLDPPSLFGFGHGCELGGKLVVENDIEK